MSQLLGNTRKGETPSNVPANYKRTSRFFCPRDLNLVKLTFYCDGLGPGHGVQVVRGIIYQADGTLLTEGVEVTVLEGQEPSWVDLPFSEPGGIEILGNRYYDFGFHAGEVANVTRVYGDPV